MSELTYEKSNHVHAEQPEADAPPAAPATEGQAGAPPQLAYDKTDQPPPQGVPADQLPDAVRELRENDDARRLFSPQTTYRDVIKIDDAWPEENKAAAAEWREIAADVGLSVSDTSELADIIYGTKEIPSAEVLVGWEREALDDLRREYGEKGAQQALADAQRLIARDPRVAYMLEETGLGSHPKFVAHVVRAARSQRGRF